MLLFAYGSNLAPEVAGGSSAVALLPDHRLALNRRSIRWGGGVADVVPRARASRCGAPPTTSTGSAMDALDRKEGGGPRLPAGPTSSSRSAANPLSAVTYVVIDKEPDAPPATDATPTLVLRGARERGLPDEWLAVLDSVLRGSVPAR